MEKKKIASIVDMYDKAGKECQKAMSEFLAGVKFALSQREE